MGDVRGSLKQDIHYLGCGHPVYKGVIVIDLKLMDFYRHFLTDNNGEGGGGVLLSFVILSQCHLCCLDTEN